MRTPRRPAGRGSAPAAFSSLSSLSHSIIDRQSQKFQFSGPQEVKLFTNYGIKLNGVSCNFKTC